MRYVQTWDMAYKAAKAAWMTDAQARDYADRVMRDWHAAAPKEGSK